MIQASANLLRGTAVLGLVVAWAVTAHWASEGKGSADLNTALGISPMIAVAGLLLWRLRHPALIAAGCLATALVVAWLWPIMRANVPLLYYLQHLGTNLALGTLFGRTLFGPGDALVTRIARGVFGDGLSARKVRYTRQVTLAWACFFFANGLVSTGLYFLAPAAIWSVYANLLGAPLIALMFLCEHLFRRRVLPPEERPTIAMAIRAYRNQGNRSGKPTATQS